MLSRRIKRLIIGFTLLIVIVLVVTVSIARYFSGLAEKRRYLEEQAQLKPRELQTVAVQRQARTRTQRYSAQVRPWTDAQVAAQASGRVTAVNVDVGSMVEAGATLVELDPAVAELDVRAAEAALESARAQFAEAQRLAAESRKLAERSVIAGTEQKAAASRVQVSAAEVTRLEAQLESLRETRRRHEIKAPFEGTVRERLVDVGDTVNLNQPVVQMAALNPLRIVFFVNEREIATFKEGQPVTLELGSQPGQKFQPVIKHVSRSADPQTRLFHIEAALPNANLAIPAGTQGIVQAEVMMYQDQLFLPASAVQLVGQDAQVERVVGEQKPETVPVQIGPELDGYYPVLSGLSEGDRVVIR